VNEEIAKVMAELNRWGAEFDRTASERDCLIRFLAEGVATKSPRSTAAPPSTSHLPR
jgi:hypothetical protein